MQRSVVVSRIVEAIEGRREVRLVYGAGASVRRILPHAIGIGRAGNPLLLAWQVAGASQTRHEGWKHFNLEQVRAVDVSVDRFAGPAPGFNPDDMGLIDVWASVDAEE